MKPNQDVLGFGDKIESEHEEKQEREKRKSNNTTAEVHESVAADAPQITNGTSSPAVKCVSIVRDIDTDRYFVRLEFRLVDDATKVTELPRELKATTMVARLLGLGAHLPHGHGQATKLLRQALDAPGLPVAETSSRTGWWEESFRTRDEVIGPASSRLTLRPRDDKLPTRAGDLAPWQAGLRRACKASSYLTDCDRVRFCRPANPVQQDCRKCARLPSGQGIAGKDDDPAGDGVSVRQRRSLGAPNLSDHRSRPGGEGVRVERPLAGAR